MARATSTWQGYAERIDPEALARVRRAAKALGWLPAEAPRPGGVARIPDRPLRLAEYLFYAGRVTWADVLAALKWQRAQRPLAGEIAVQLGFLTRKDVRDLLAMRCSERAFSVPFCEFARSKGLLSEAQRTAVIGQQRRSQCRIGEYFVERGLLDPAELDQLAGDHRLHDARVRCAREHAPPRAHAPAASKRR